MQWLKKYVKPTLVKVKKLWEKYWEMPLPQPTVLAFSYDNPKELRELDTFDQIVLSLQLVVRPLSEDEYVDYNSQDSFSLGSKGALEWWC